MHTSAFAYESEMLEAKCPLLTPPPLIAEEIQYAAKIAAAVCNSAITAVCLSEDEHPYLHKQPGFEQFVLPPDNIFHESLTFSQQLLYVADASCDLRFCQHPLVLSELGIRLFIGLPLLSSTGDLLGSICVIDTIPHILTEQQKEAFILIGERLAKFIESRFITLEPNKINHIEEILPDFQQSAELVPQQVWTAGEDGTLNYVNQRIIDYYGFSSNKEGLGLTWREVVHHEDLNRFMRLWMKTSLRKKSFEMEYRLRRADGEYRWHLVQASPIQDKAGNILRWHGTNTDIHERKISEDARRENEVRHNLFQNAHDAILILEFENEIIIDANDKACALYGYTRSEFIGRKISEIAYDPAESDIYWKELQQNGVYQTFETLRYSADGKLIDMLVNSSVIDYYGQQVVLSINRDITERKRADHLRSYDTLTNLPNRVGFIEYLQQTILQESRDSKAMFGVLFLNLDCFKIINDSLGYSEGDKILVLIAERLQSVLRLDDKIARLGGDEFAILINEISDPDDTKIVAARIHKNLNKSFNLGGNEFFITTSIGIVIGTKDSKPSEILRDANTAVTRAKSEGRGRTKFFHRFMHKEASDRLRLENDLQRALERKEFQVHYQPIIDLRSNQIKGFEALLRWRHPNKGMIPPLDFVPVAEETGLIVPIGEWVMRESSHQLRKWQLAHPAHADLTMSVNISLKQFSNADLVNQILKIVRDSEIATETLQLELTESHLANNENNAVGIMKELRNAGLKIAIDDFGTGYSSLSYLHLLPFDFLKIDRSFVSRMLDGSERGEIVRTIVMLAKKLSFKLIAEGIETVEQSNYLRSLDCEYGQGYLFSKPVETHYISDLLNAQIQFPVVR